MSLDVWLFYGSVACLLLGLGCLIAARLLLDEIEERRVLADLLLASAESALRELEREQTKHTATGISQ